MSSPARLLLSCEHGGRQVPARWRDLFEGREELLSSHRGWDPGTLELARLLSRRLEAPLVASTTTRLLVDLNRSPGHPQLFSEISRRLGAAELERILAEHYHPHRRRIEATLGGLLAVAPVVHVAVHSFTPVLAGRVRRADVGLLYDPRRPGETAFARRWQAALKRRLPGMQIHRNSPYRGWADGLATHLRKLHEEPLYRGFELEVNQRFPLAGGRPWRDLQEALAGTLGGLLAKPQAPILDGAI